MGHSSTAPAKIATSDMAKGEGERRQGSYGSIGGVVLALLALALIYEFTSTDRNYGTVVGTGSTQLARSAVRFPAVVRPRELRGENGFEDDEVEGACGCGSACVYLPRLTCLCLSLRAIPCFHNRVHHACQALSVVSRCAS